MLNGGDEGGAVAAVIAQPVDVDLVVRVAGLIVDLEIDRATDIGADAGGETLDRRRSPDRDRSATRFRACPASGSPGTIAFGPVVSVTLPVAVLPAGSDTV